jgi:hypothetical protein
MTFEKRVTFNYGRQPSGGSKAEVEILELKTSSHLF